MLKLGLPIRVPAGKTKQLVEAGDHQPAGTHSGGTRTLQSSGAKTLHRKSIELSSITRQSPIAKTKNLIGALLSHGARTRRASKQPVTVRLRVFTPNGNKAVQFGYK